MTVNGIGATGHVIDNQQRRSGVTNRNTADGNFAQVIQQALTNSVSSWYRPSYVAVPIVITEEAYEKMKEDSKLSENIGQSWWNNGYGNMTAFPLLGINPSVASAYQQILNGFTGSIL